MCVWRRRPPTCFWLDGSPKFVVVLCWSNRRSRDRPNYVAPTNLTKTLLWACKLFLKSDIFSKTFVGRPSVGVSRISRFQNPTVHVSIVSQETCVRCQYDEHALWSWSSSKRNLPFSRPKVTIAYFFGESYNGRSFGWTAINRHQQSEPAGHRHEVKRETDCTEKRRSTSAHSKDITWRSRETELQAASRKSNREFMSFSKTAFF